MREELKEAAVKLDTCSILKDQGFKLLVDAETTLLTKGAWGCAPINVVQPVPFAN